MNRGMLVDVLAIVAFLALGITHALTGHEAAMMIAVVVAGRLRPPEPSSSSGGSEGPPGGVLTIALAIGSTVSHAVDAVRHVAFDHGGPHA